MKILAPCRKCLKSFNLMKSLAKIIRWPSFDILIGLLPLIKNHFKQWTSLKYETLFQSSGEIFLNWHLS